MAPTTGSHGLAGRGHDQLDDPAGRHHPVVARGALPQAPSGRFFTQAEVDRRARVVVLGADTASELFGGRSAVGQTVTVEGAASP